MDGWMDGKCYASLSYRLLSDQRWALLSLLNSSCIAVVVGGGDSVVVQSLLLLAAWSVLSCVPAMKRQRPD